MNLQHLKTYLWLRWRLRANQIKRTAWVGVLIQRVLIVGGIAAGVLTFSGFLAVGLLVLGEAEVPTPILMLVWDGLIGVFLFFWLIGLLTELQRSELLSVERFLQLPVSPSGVFLINYLGSILTPSIVIFVPGMIGLALGLSISRGPLMLGLFPLIGAFIVALTALTYQFRGWLAALMTNKRRRRTILMVVTLSFVIVTQLPYLVSRNFDRREERGDEVELAEIQRVAGTVNRIVPFGWLPYGATTLAEGRVLPATLGTLGLLALGGVSLRRSYNTTLRLYGGELTTGASGRKPRAPVRSEPVSPSAAGAKTTLLERQLPWISEHAAAIALTSFRSLTRAPEAKMMLLTPVIMVAVFGGMFLSRDGGQSVFMRPLTATGAFVMVLVSLMQLGGNQFGFDRAGFRAFLLSSARRRDILLGKNLALMPLALALGAIVLSLLQWLRPMRVDHFLAVIMQMLAMYLIFCVVGNLLSIFAPIPIASGSLRPVKPRGMVILLNVASLVAFPIALAPTLLPLGIELGLNALGLVEEIPLYLLLTLIEAAVVVWLYAHILEWQGRLFQAREQQILETVTAQAE